MTGSGGKGCHRLSHAHPTVENDAEQVPAPPREDPPPEAEQSAMIPVIHRERVACAEPLSQKGPQSATGASFQKLVDSRDRPLDDLNVKSRFPMIESRSVV
jgi:hypothetical protein